MAGHDCKPFSKVLVEAIVPGTNPIAVACTSEAAFLLHVVTNGQDFGIGVKSTGAGFGSSASSFTIGAGANDTVTFDLPPGIAVFITLQTECGAKAGIAQTVV